MSGEKRPRSSVNVESNISGPTDRLTQWRRDAQCIYDTMIYYNLMWGSLSCTFLQDVTSTNSQTSETQEYSSQKLMFSSRTDGKFISTTNKWRGNPGYLYLASMEIPSANRTDRKKIARTGTAKSSKISFLKKIIHPGEVNRIVPSPNNSNLVATHSDSHLVYIWNLDLIQDYVPGRGEKDIMEVKQAEESAYADKPWLTLLGHKKKAEYCLSWSKSSTHVLSGGVDGKLCIWDLASSMPAMNSMEEDGVPAYHQLSGHESVIEDGKFHPSDGGNTIVSVSDDRSVCFWDVRSQNPLQHRLKDFHAEDINCCSWNSLDTHYILTGGSDRCIKLLDTRKLGEKKCCVLEIPNQESEVVNIAWSPHHKDYFAATADSLIVWKLGVKPEGPVENVNVVFKHLGHGSNIVDFDWSSTDPWTFLSVSDVSQDEASSGSLQCWRISDLVVNRETTYMDKLRKIYSQSKINKT